MQDRFSIFKVIRGETTKNGYLESNVGCNGSLHATWIYEAYLKDPSNPDSEHLDSEDISRLVIGPCDHSCDVNELDGSGLYWFLCETKTRPKLVLIK